MVKHILYIHASLLTHPKVKCVECILVWVSSQIALRSGWCWAVWMWLLSESCNLVSVTASTVSVCSTAEADVGGDKEIMPLGENVQYVSQRVLKLSALSLAMNHRQVVRGRHRRNLLMKRHLSKWYLLLKASSEKSKVLKNLKPFLQLC